MILNWATLLPMQGGTIRKVRRGDGGLLLDHDATVKK